MANLTPEERMVEFRSKLTPEFLETLVEAVRIVGWNVDMNETESFVQILYSEVGLVRPLLEPYRY